MSSYEDISILLWTTGAVAGATREVSPLFWQRHLALLLGGLRAACAEPLPQPPLTSRQHIKVMVEVNSPRGARSRQTSRGAQSKRAET